jgi:hypothetical protein
LAAPFDFASSPLFGAFEEDPLGRKANFLSRLPAGLGGGAFNFGESQFDPTMNRWLAQVGGQARSGQKTSPFDDFLNQFDLRRTLLREQPQRNRFLTSPATFRF